MATNSSILAWETQGQNEPGGLQSMGLQKSETRLSDSHTHIHTHTHTHPQQASLEDPELIIIRRLCFSGYDLY